MISDQVLQGNQECTQLFLLVNRGKKICFLGLYTEYICLLLFPNFIIKFISEQLIYIYISETEDPKRKSSGKKIMHSSTPDELGVIAQKVNCDVKGGGRHESEALTRMARIVEERNNQDSDDSEYGASEKLRAEVGEKRKHKKSKRQDSDDGHSSDSQLEGRKEAKRRKKEDKKLRKEERRRRREERRRKKDERRAEKLKLKAGGTVSPPSDFEENHQGHISDGARAGKRDSRVIDSEEQSEQKKLEIALREKAIETLRAKKGAGH